MSGNPSKRIEVRLYGHADIAPGKIKIQYTTRLLNAIEKAVITCAKEIDPLLDEALLVMSLDSLREGSQWMGMTVSEPCLLDGAEMFFGAVREKRVSTLPLVAQNQVMEIQQVQKKLGCDISVHRGSVVSEPPIVVFLCEHPLLLPKPIKMKDAKARGRVMRVGGKHPSLVLDLMNGEVLNCRGERSVIQELAKYLYQEVEVQGIAWIDGITLRKNELIIEGFRLWRPVKAAEGFRELRSEFGRFFDQIEDVDAHVRAKRGEDDATEDAIHPFNEGAV